MATECDVNKSRRFDRGMSRRTRKPTSLVACYEDRYMPPLARQLLHEARLKRLFQCEDAELQPPQQCEDAEQQMEIPQVPLEYKGVEKKVQELYQDEQEKKVPELYQDDQEKNQLQFEDEEPEKKPLQCEDEEQEKKPQPHQDEEQNIPKQYQDEEEKTQQYEDEEQNIPKQYQDEERTGQQREDDDAPEQCLEEEKRAPEQYQDNEEKEQDISEQYQGEVQMTEQQWDDEKEQTITEAYQDEEEKTGKQCQDEDEKTPEQYQNEDEKTSEQYQDKDEQKAQQGRQAMEQKTLVQHLEVPFTPLPVDNVPRLSLLELIREKQLGTGEGKGTSNFGYGENAFANRRAPVPVAGGPTLAMVIRRHDGGKKPTGILRRCVKALNQMVKAKHGSKKNVPIKEV